MVIEDELQDRYGAAATPEDAKRLAYVVKAIFEKMDREFGAQAGYNPRARNDERDWRSFGES